MQKIPKIKSKKLRYSAKGEECTFNITDACNHNPETTVLCHLPSESKGIGTKSDDFCAAFGSSDCHRVIDSTGLSDYEKEWYMRRAQIRTLRRWFSNGTIEVK